jgi:DNA modification methylase
LKDVFTEVHRITEEGRFCVINCSPVLKPRLSRSHQSKHYPIPFDLHQILSDVGFQFIDDIIWEKPEPSVKDRNSQFRNNRKPLTYKPNIVTEYVLVYRKKTDKLIDWNLKKYDKKITDESLILGDIERTNIWKISPKSSKFHPAVFPESLCERIIAYYSYVGDIVFDPFAGIGTCCKAVKEKNRKYFGIEKNYEYYCYANNRLK